jgi:mono/diheme cytochrome c family protein
MKLNFIKFVALIVVCLFCIGVFLTRNTNTQIIENKQITPKDLFLNNCARCHGADGKSQTVLGKEIKATDLTGKKTRKLNDAKIVKAITNGKGKMSAFGKKLKADEIKSLAEFIKTL